MICLDASVAVKLLLPEEWSDWAVALYNAAIQADEPIVAPPLLPIEVTNILWQRTRVPVGIRRLEALGQLERFLASAIEIHNPPDLHQHALMFAAAFELPATYDAHYLALAEHFGCPLWTADQRLLRAVGGRLPFVRAISEYAATG